MDIFYIVQLKVIEIKFGEGGLLYTEIYNEQCFPIELPNTCFEVREVTSLSCFYLFNSFRLCTSCCLMIVLDEC